MITQLYKYNKTRRLIYFKLVNYMVCDLYLNQAFLKKKKKKKNCQIGLKKQDPTM